MPARQSKPDLPILMNVRDKLAYKLRTIRHSKWVAAHTRPIILHRYLLYLDPGRLRARRWPVYQGSAIMRYTLSGHYPTTYRCGILLYLIKMEVHRQDTRRFSVRLYSSNTCTCCTNKAAHNEFRKASHRRRHSPDHR
jgi:hypothetical protein